MLVRHLLIDMVAPLLERLLKKASDLGEGASSSADELSFAEVMATCVTMIDAYLHTDHAGLLRATPVCQVDVFVVACGIVDNLRERRFPRADIFQIMSESYMEVAKFEGIPAHHTSLYTETARMHEASQQVDPVGEVDEPGTWLRECRTGDPTVDAASGVLLLASLVNAPAAHVVDDSPVRQRFACPTDVRRRSAMSAIVAAKLLGEDVAAVRARVMERAVGLYEVPEVAKCAPRILEAVRGLPLTAPHYLLRILDKQYKDLLGTLVQNSSKSIPL